MFGHAERGDCRIPVCFANHHTDDVRAISEIRQGNQARNDVSGGGTGVSMERGNVRGGFWLGFAPPTIHARSYRRDQLPQRLFIYRDSQGFFSATGYRPDDRKYPGGSGYFLPVNAIEIETIH